MQSPDSMQELMSCDDAAISGQTYKFHIGTQVQGGDPAALSLQLLEPY